MTRKMAQARMSAHIVDITIDMQLLCIEAF